MPNITSLASEISDLVMACLQASDALDQGQGDPGKQTTVMALRYELRRQLYSAQRDKPAHWPRGARHDIEIWHWCTCDHHGAG